MSEDFVLCDGGEVGYLISYQPIRYKCYSPKSQQHKNGIYGRHQVMNEFGGWDNASFIDRDLSVIVRDKPDAKLIAAAPELLEALEAVERAEPLWLPHDADPQYAHEEEALHKLAGKVRAAIAKAKS